MIPYFDQPQIPLGPLSIHAFGVLVVIGVLVATAVLKRRAERDGLDPSVAQSLATWMLVGGFVGAHLVDRFVYFPAETMSDPLSIVRIFDGLSSFGGFVGAIAAILVRRRALGGQVWRYLDTIAFAFPLGWLFGRLGCFVAFDHPGSPTSMFLGQEYRDGIVRHNLGLEEAIYTLLMAAIMLVLGNKRRPVGFYVGLLATLYAPFRFGLDYLRKVDVRYLGLTPAQYGSVVVFGAGVFILIRAQEGSAR
jgi:phosphatidylglycerol---prolipoprotein diacylglyceryl transferase